MSCSITLPNNFYPVVKELYIGDTLQFYDGNFDKGKHFVHQFNYFNDYCNERIELQINILKESDGIRTFAYMIYPNGITYCYTRMVLIEKQIF